MGNKISLINEFDLKKIFGLREPRLTPNQKKILSIIWNKKGFDPNRLESDLRFVGYYTKDKLQPEYYTDLFFDYYGGLEKYKEKILQEFGVYKKETKKDRSLINPMGTIFLKLGDIQLVQTYYDNGVPKNTKMYLKKIYLHPSSTLKFTTLNRETTYIPVLEIKNLGIKQLMEKYLPQIEVGSEEYIQYQKEIYGDFKELIETIKENASDYLNKIAREKFFVQTSPTPKPNIPKVEIVDFDLGNLNESVIRIKNLISFSDY